MKAWWTSLAMTRQVHALSRGKFLDLTTHDIS